MRKYLKIFKINLLEEMQYKSAFISGIICQFAFGFMYIFLYMAFFESGVPQDFSLPQMVGYLWLGQSFFALLNYFDINKKNISKEIVTGNVSYQFIKPINIYNYWYAQCLSTGISKSLVRCVPIIIVALLLPAPYNLILPTSALSFILFLISLVLSSLLVSAIRMICYIITLYTLDARGVFNFAIAICGFLGGTIVPIPLLPKTLQYVLNFLPFRYVSDLPYRIYIGNFSYSSCLIQIAIQFGWVIALIAIGKVIVNKKSKNLIVQGG